MEPSRQKHVEGHGDFRIVAYVGFPILNGNWIEKDTRGRQAWRMFDAGFPIAIFWPVVPYYVLRSRGAKGLIPVGGFIGIWLLAFFEAVLLFGASPG